MLAAGLLAMVAGVEPAQATTYGCAWNADGLANLAIGKYPGRAVDIRFRAEHGGALAHARFYFIFKKGRSGYQSGNGGKILIQVQADDGTGEHHPSGTVLGSALVTDPLADLFPLVTFDPPVTVAAGGLYHLVMTNVDPDPETNWVSIDDLYDQANTPAMQPAVSDTDLAMLFQEDGTPWHVAYAHTPILDVRYEDGFVQGQGYIDARLRLRRRIAGSSRVRERFTVTGSDRAVTAVSLRVLRIRSPKPLGIRLEAGDGTLIEQGTVDGSLVGTVPTWVSYTFQTPRILAQGETYDLVVSADRGHGSYTIYPLQEGTSYGFTTPTMFLDGVAQYSSGSRWLNFLRTRTDFDYQLFFTLSEP